MDSSLQGAAALGPLLQQAVGDPSVAALGGEELDRVMLATEMVVSEIAHASRVDAELYSSVAQARTDEAIARRRLQLQGLRSELLDRATDLALRFEALLDELEQAEAELAYRGGGEPAETDEQIAAIKQIVSERQRVTAAHEISQEPVIFEQAQSPPQPYVDAGAGKRRWWQRLRGEAA